MIRFVDGWATDMTYSPDEKGWWAQAIGVKGETVFTTEVYPNKQDAINALGEFTEKNKAPDYRKTRR